MPIIIHEFEVVVAEAEEPERSDVEVSEASELRPRPTSPQLLEDLLRRRALRSARLTAH